MSEAPINSREWWEAYFAHDWEALGGPEQSRHFMEALLGHLPASIANFLQTQPNEILDWGCAQGEGVAALAQAFPLARVAGLDFSERAIQVARRRFSHHEFIWTKDGSLPREFDVIVTSNCLEHFEQPLALVRDHLRRCRLLYLALVPYNEHPFDPQHRAQFREESFPEHWAGFRRLHTGLVAVDPKLWAAPQLLAIYGSPEYLRRVSGLLPTPVSEEAQANGAHPPADTLRVTSLHTELALRTADLLASHSELRELLKKHGEVERQAALLAAKVQELHGWTEALQTRLNERDRVVVLLEGRETELRHAKETLEHEVTEARVDIERMHTECARRDAELTSLRSDLEREQALLRERTTQLDAERQQVCDDNAVLRHRVATLESEVTAHQNAATQQVEALRNLESRVAGLDQEVTAARAMILALQGESQGFSARAWHAEHKLDDIYRSTGWRFLQTLYRARATLFPRNSRRERAVKWAMHKQRRVRETARRGPRALLQVTGAWLARVWRERLWGIPAVRRIALPTPAADPVAQQAAEVTGRVSVVLPVYNQAHLLRAALESVLAQTYRNFELIIINDGSTDAVTEVLGTYASHPQVRVLTQPNQGLPKALSNGFDFATGEFWTWTSADNLMEPQQLERQVAFLRDHPEAGMVYCDYLAIDDRGEPLRDPSWRPQNRRTPETPEIHLPHDTSNLNIVQDNFIGACFMYRGWVGRVLGDYAPILGVEDYDYWMRLNTLFSIHHLGTDELLYRYRVHDNTLSGRAVEHDIYSRAQRLLWYDGPRRSYYGRRWKIFVDAATAQRLEGVELHGHTLTVIADPSEAARAREEVLFILSAESLPKLSTAALPKERCVVVWFEDDATRPYTHASEIEHQVDACIAPDAATAERLALSTRRVFRVEPGPDMFALAIALASNDLFARKTLPPEDCARALPQVYRPGTAPQRVLLQVQAFDQGGLERVVLDVAATLDPQQFEPLVLVLGKCGAAADEARRAGLRVIVLPEHGRTAAYRNLLRNERIALVNAHYSTFGADLAAEAGIPFVQTLHNTYVWATPEDIAAYQAADAATAAYICVSAPVAWHAEHRLGLPATKLLVVPNGIDTVRAATPPEGFDRAAARQGLGLSDDDFAFLCAASLANVKAQLHLVRALAEARTQDPRIKVLMLGGSTDAEYEALLQAEIARLGLGDAARHIGYHADPRPFYHLADAFVLPSFVEGWSLALAEALCAGLPLVATEVGSTHDLLTQTGGQRVKPPFASMLDYDHVEFFQLTRREHPQFVDDLATALVATAADPEPPVLLPTLRWSIDRANAYQAYARLFAWVIGGGQPAAARPLVRELHVWRGEGRHLTADPLRGDVALGNNGHVAKGPAFKPRLRSQADVNAQIRDSRGAVVFLLSIDWSQWLFQRPHHLARYFAQQGYVAIYDDSNRFTGFAGYKEIEPNLYLYRGQKERLHSLPNPLLWTYCYNYQLHDGFPAGSRVVYDLIDDFAVHPYDRQLMERNHQRAMAEADVVAYVARHLAAFLEARPDRLYLPNGVEFERFAGNPPPLPPDRTMRRILRQGKPIAGYYGALAEWFDYKLLDRVARARPDWNFVLIGPNYDGSLQGQRVLSCPNVHWLGPRDYHVLPAYLQAFTVATIPFAINDITLATSPLKLYEYFAGGKPVITSPMPECMAFPEVAIVKNAAEFQAALEAAQQRATDTDFTARLRALARENAWEARVTAVEAALAHHAARTVAVPPAPPAARVPAGR